MLLRRGGTGRNRRKPPRGAPGDNSEKRVHPARGVEVTNMVFLARLSYTPPNLAAALALCGNYDTKFTAWVVRPRSATGTMAVFKNGKVIVAGCRSLDDARLAVEQLAYALSRRFSRPVGVVGLDVQNVVGAAYLGYEVDLQRMKDELSHCCRYHPRKFPGLQYSWYNDTERQATSRVQDRPQYIAIVIFKPGSVVLTGARRSVDVLRCVFEECQSLFLRFRKV